MSECREEHEGHEAIPWEISEPGRADLAERYSAAGSEACRIGVAAGPPYFFPAGAR